MTAHVWPRALRERVRLVGDDVMSAAMPVRQGIVEIAMKDGPALRHHIPSVRGTPGNPMTRQQVHEKCHGLIAPVMGAAQSDELYALVWRLEDLADVRQLRRLLHT